MKKKKIFSAITIMCMLFPTMAGAMKQKAELNGMPERTPEENVFAVDGYTQRFALLDTTEDDKSKYLIMLIDNCGTAVFDGDNTQRFDPNDKNNIAYRLNTEFLSANISLNVATGLAPSSSDSITSGLPQVISAHIDKGHIWRTEGGNQGGLCPESYAVEAAISILSQEELVKYKNKVGRKDDITSRGALGWWLRTPADAKAMQLLTVRLDDDSLYAERPAEYDANKGMALRPVFYVDKDFFKSVRLSPYSLGKNIIATMKHHHTQEELAKLYTRDELWNYLGYKADISITGETDEVGADIEITNNLNTQESVIVTAVMYNEKNEQSGYSAKYVTLEAGGRQNIQFEFSTEFRQKQKLVVFAWDMSQSPMPVSNIITLKI